MSFATSSFCSIDFFIEFVIEFSNTLLSNFDLSFVTTYELLHVMNEYLFGVAVMISKLTNVS